MTKKEIQDYKDKRNLKYGFNAYWNKGFNEAITLLNKQEEAINYTHSCKSDSEQLVLFADWLQYNGKWSLPEQQAKDFLKEQQEQN